MISAFVALGANLGEPLAQIRQAVAALQQLPSSRFIACSPLYGSVPMGPSDQPDYVNGVAWLETFTAADAFEGDQEGFQARDAAWYRRNFRAVGFQPLGSHLWLGPQWAGQTSALETPVR